MNIELSKAEIDSILKDKSNPLYRRIQDLFPVEILPTIESLYGEGKIEGYYLTPSGTINFVELSGRCDDNIWAVNGMAPTKSVIERTVLEYKIQHLIIANGLEGNTYSLSYCPKMSKIIALDRRESIVGVLQMNGTSDEVGQFVRNYYDLLMEYFNLF